MEDRACEDILVATIVPVIAEPAVDVGDPQGLGLEQQCEGHLHLDGRRGDVERPDPGQLHGGGEVDRDPLRRGRHLDRRVGDGKFRRRRPRRGPGDIRRGDLRQRRHGTRLFLQRGGQRNRLGPRARQTSTKASARTRGGQRLRRRIPHIANILKWNGESEGERPPGPIASTSGARPRVTPVPIRKSSLLPIGRIRIAPSGFFPPRVDVFPDRGKDVPRVLTRMSPEKNPRPVSLSGPGHDIRTEAFRR